MFDTGLMEADVEVQCGRSIVELADVVVSVRNPYVVVGAIVAAESAVAVAAAALGVVAVVVVVSVAVVAVADGAGADGFAAAPAVFDATAVVAADGVVVAV
jgi:hypothetical protein